MFDGLRQGVLGLEICESFYALPSVELKAPHNFSLGQSVGKNGVE